MALKTPILISCRIRPSLDDGNQEIQEYTVKQTTDKCLLSITNHQVSSLAVNHKPDSYNFQFVRVFDQKTSQQVIYDAVADPIVKSALEGYNGTIFAYGQTGSGKTHTISGDLGNYGIIPRALQNIFVSIGAAREEKFEVQMSYLEIYNEHSHDLLNKEGKKKISLREGGDKVFEWHNLTLCPVESFLDAMALMDLGDRNRNVANTPMNNVSSRSHTILTIYLANRAEVRCEIRRAKLNLVDLAGSERVHKTGDGGAILEEAKYINLSLHYLQQVIIALADSSRRHVPYRNCSLTAALRDSLGGNCMTAMVANITMDKANLEETISTCRFAQRVAMVRNEVTVNLERDLREESVQLRGEIEQLRSQCASLRTKVRQLEKDKVSRKDEIPKTEEEVPSTSDNLNIQQLQTDIVYLIGWIQDELKGKQNTILLANDSSSFSSLSALSTVDEDDGFDGFAVTLEENEEWSRVKEEELNISDDLSIKRDKISSVHQEILSYWKQQEKSLVREMLDGRILNIPNSDSILDLASTDDFSSQDLIIEKLLLTHSDLLKDIQLLKSRLRSSRRSLQRIKRKNLLKFDNWKKTETIARDNLSKNPIQCDNTGSFNKEQESLKSTLEFYESKSINPVDEYIGQNSNLNHPAIDEGSKYGKKDATSKRHFSNYVSDLKVLRSLDENILSRFDLTSNSNCLTLPRPVRSVPGLQFGLTNPRSRFPFSAYDKLYYNRPLSTPSVYFQVYKENEE